jgi:cellobiose-specific phosphotransferase system component IIA
VSYDEYLKKIKIRDEIFDNSQSKLLRENLNYKKTRYSIITSVLDDIIGHRPEYKKIWLMICLLDSDDISKDFLKTPECDTMTDAFIHNLLEHSLIIDNGDTFGIHRITQEIGLQYMEEKLSDCEKIKYSDEIVNRMSCCEKIACRFYEGQDSPTIFGDRVKTARHLQSIMRKIQKLNFGENKKKEYDIKLGLALFHCFENLKTTEFMQEFAEKIIRQNESENVLKDTDLAVLLEICASKCICSAKIDDAKKYLSQSMTLCKKLKFNNCIRVFCLSDCAALAVLEKNYDEAEKYLKEARQLLKNFQKSWQLQTAAEIFKRYCDCYKNCSEQSEEKLRCIIDFGTEILKALDVNRTFYADSIFLIKKETAELCKKIENETRMQ